MLQALSEEMLKLRSASQHYDETRINLQKMVESIDKISQTNQKLAENMSLAIAEMEKTNIENKKTQEFIQKLYDETKNIFEAEIQKHEVAVKASLTEKISEISAEVRKQTDMILQDYSNQSKIIRQFSAEFRKQTEKINQDNARHNRTLEILKLLLVAGVVLEAIIIIRTFLF